MKVQLDGPKVRIMIATFAMLLIASLSSQAQKIDKHISAHAMGTGTQMGRIIQIDVRLTELSTPEDQKHLIEAFNENRTEGMVNALEKMSSKGRIAITGTVGYDLKYVRLIKLNGGGYKIRFVTDRPVTFGEHWGMTRSQDYSMTMGEFTILKPGGKVTGTLIPAGRLTLDKEKQLEIEAFQNPWDLNHIKVWK